MHRPLLFGREAYCVAWHKWARRRYTMSRDRSGQFAIGAYFLSRKHCIVGYFVAVEYVNPEVAVTLLYRLVLFLSVVVHVEKLCSTKILCMLMRMSLESSSMRCNSSTATTLGRKQWQRGLCVFRGRYCQLVRPRLALLQPSLANTVHFRATYE